MKKKIKFLCYLLLVIFISQDSFKISAQSLQKSSVFVLTINGDINPQTNRYVKLALEQAKEEKADLILLDLDTYGGLVTDADEIRTQLLDLDIPTAVFINKDAASAGALIAISCDSIYMAAGSSIGAATVVLPTSEAAPDKYQSYMKSIMRSTAEAKNRNPEIAEAMVDQEIEIPGVTAKGKVISFSNSEAIKHGFCESEVTSLEEIIDKYGFADYEINSFNLSSADKIIDFFINPFISGILILIILGGIYFELQSPGIGFPIAASIVALVLYLTPYYLNGLAENWELAIFCIGILALIAEILILPGFGVFGVVGLSCIIGSLILMMLNNDFFDFTFVPSGSIRMAILVALGGLVGAVAAIILLAGRLPESKAFSKIANQTKQNRSDGYTSNFYVEELIGVRGTAFTRLRPSGKVEISGQVYDAYTRGDFIERGTEVEVISQEGTSIQVKRLV